MFDLSLSIFGRYITIHMGRITDVWEDEDDEEPPVQEEPEPPADMEKDTTCVYVEDDWYAR